ncbi:hypothetical protein [Rhodopirellula sallentina]|uniref:Uncharacterized protein n=1 Tax=Rhodopirellula sallentina SM41 TaxID=1263870 RepID=M5U3J2_9BACT|nr:hypothetical protein [Rhodopirellula sallentina]EMI56025.1 hypothetical protein RSSM_02523 [Rhodopirellula sallentina SM41]
MEALAKGNNYAACWGFSDMLSWEQREIRGAFGTYYVDQDLIITTVGGSTTAGDRFVNRNGMKARDIWMD